MVPFTPRLVPAILPNLAHHVSMIQLAAIRTNKLLFTVIQRLPSPVEVVARPPPLVEKPPTSRMIRSPTPSATNSRQSTMSSQDTSSPIPPSESPTIPPIALQRHRASATDVSLTPRATSTVDLTMSAPPASEPSRPHSPVSFASNVTGPPPNPEDMDLFDYQATVNELTVQFLSEFEETRVAALKWLIMLHQKAPKKVGLHYRICSTPLLILLYSDSRHG